MGVSYELIDYELIEKWVAHCKSARHITQVEALELGKNPNSSKYATYKISQNCRRIYCCLESCDWKESADV